MRHPDYLVNPATGCWVWQKSTRQGYGRVRRGEKVVTAHVWYWEQKHGPVPDGMQLDHTCHSNTKSCRGGSDCPHRRCVNPDHLEPVLHAENAQRGRLAKLTREQVAEIRERSNVPVAALMARYGVSKPTIAKIRAGQIWQGIGEPHEHRKVLGAPPLRGVRLTETQIAAIRAAPRYHGSGRALAHKYGVSDARISALRG